jgi:2-succinyl-6-hydroxy-2,4-cyclohexadiene-1-carboxylate synthase
MARDVVLLHGFTHTGASWDPVVAALGESYRALAPDIRGHGSAAEREPVTLGGVLHDLSELAPGKFTLVGYSMGGRLALHAAVAWGLSTRIDRLVLIGASPGIADPSEREARRVADERLAGEVDHMTIDEFAEHWARTPVLAGQPPEVAAAVRADRMRNQPVGLAGALRGLGTGALPSLWDRLHQIRAPVALVVGERDDKFRSIAAEMARELPDANVVVIPDAAHAVHLEAPARVAALIGPSAPA